MKRMSIGKNIIFLVIILLILLVTAMIILFSMRTDPIKNALASDNLLKILFVIEEDNVPLSTNIIAYYPQSKRAAMFDIPQNIGLILQSLGRTDGISVLYTEKGMDAYIKEVEKLTGISIPFYVSCSLDSFSHITDLLSGISVFIPAPIDEQVQQGDAEHHFLIPSGSVVLDGDKVRDYLVYSNDDEIETTSRRQKAVLAVLRGVHDEKTAFFDSSKYDVFFSLVQTNLGKSDFKNLLQTISYLDSERLVPQRFSGARRVVDGKELLFPYRDGQQVKEIIRQTFAVLASEEGSAFERVYAVEILNGTQTHGLARGAAEIYENFGYDVAHIGNAPPPTREKTVIIDRIGNPSVAKAMGRIIHCQNIEESDSIEDGHGADNGIDFTLILGQDFDGSFVREKK